MKPQTHVKLGGIADVGLLLIRFLNWIEFVFFFLATVGVDFDHYVNFIFRTWRRRRRFGNLIQYLKYVRKTAPAFYEAHVDAIPWGKDFLDMFPFHTVEFWLSIYGLKRLADIYGFSLVSDILMGIFWGVAFHLLLDVLWHIKKKMLFRKSWFLIEYPIRKWWMKKKKGLDPDKIFREILDFLEESSNV